MNVKKSPTPAIDRAVARSVNFELTIADLARRSERRAWMVAFCAIALALILAGGYFYMLPLKQKVPYLVMADAYTGTATVAHLAGAFGPHGITANEAINRSNVAHFVLARESYDLAMLNLGDWKTVQTMASPGVKAAYMAEYSSQNPDSLYKQYGKERAIRIRLLSIVLLGGGAGRPPRGATVRFQRSLYDKATGATHPMDNKIATLEFTYKPNLEMDDQSRIENPLGFWVTSYRVDNDYASAPPPEVGAGTVPTVVEPQAAPVASQTPSPATSATTAGSSAGGARP
ncbi:MAG: conjugative transfer protein [Lysobacterales bacterium 13-68-4]|jgi:type IV secretion system protein VirB8|nr:MAG: conjugative transfer protein [Xanthomonadales bacterium 15-68-25]OZB67729.1 MAG: conjugative transfer protein [Xanthomonadales bacterium 14-68-21]OZB72677.1 MAG: conjugative transfer protein [Xanthomonadales bacterium 13-68-4]